MRCQHFRSDLLAEAGYISVAGCCQLIIKILARDSLGYQRASWSWTSCWQPCAQPNCNACGLQELRSYNARQKSEAIYKEDSRYIGRFLHLLGTLTRSPSVPWRRTHGFRTASGAPDPGHRILVAHMTQEPVKSVQLYNHPIA